VSRRKLSLKKLKQRLDYEQRNLLYVCNEGHIPVTFSDAFELGFICTVCGEELAQKDNTKTIEFLETKIKLLDAVVNSGLDEFEELFELRDNLQKK
jgi:transcription initiation factor TFIIE subunit alpha